MKTGRHAKILELIEQYEIETQEELLGFLQRDGYQVTQATVSRDIRQLKLTKVALNNGKQRYTSVPEAKEPMSEKYVRVLKDGYVSMDMAQNILVIKTVSGMASAVCASIDAMQIDGIVGSIAGDDTIMCAIRTVEETLLIKNRLHKIIEG